MVGVYAGLVRPGYFAGLQLAPEPRLADAIRANGYNAPAAAMFVASFEAAALKTLDGLTRVRRVQRIGAEAGPARDDGASLAEMTGVDGLAAVRAYAQVVAPDASWVLDGANPRNPAPTALTNNAHAAGLALHAWISQDESAHRLQALFAAGVDGVCVELARPARKFR